MRYSEFINILLEGGNVFKDPAGQILTQRINQADIAPTIKWLESITGLPLLDNTLGSVGKKATSGDLDIAVDQSKVSKDDLVNKLSAWLMSQKVDPKTWIRKTGISVHFLTPIKGNPSLGFVQTDFMFGTNIDQMKFGLFSAGDASKFSGAERNMLMSSIAKAMNLKYTWQKGLVSPETGEVVSNDPNKIAKALLGASAKPSDFDSVETMIAVLVKDAKRLAVLKGLVEKLKSSEKDQEREEATRIEAAIRALQ